MFWWMLVNEEEFLLCITLARESYDFGGFVENFEGYNSNSLLVVKFTCDIFETIEKCSPLMLFYFMLTVPRWWPTVFNQTRGCSKFGVVAEISLCGQEE